MKLYAMSDIHGCLAEFEDALELVLDHLEEPDTMLVIPVLLVDTKEDSYFRVTQGGTWKIEPYEELDY